MSSPEDGTLVQSPPLSATKTPLDVTKLKEAGKDVISNISTSSLPDTTTPASILTSRTSILPERTARSLSPSGRALLSTRYLERSSTASSLINQVDGADDTRTLTIRGFSPTVGVFASPDTDDLARRKGFKHGFAELIRPFGETVSGKVVVRDSVGASRAWDDFGVKFVDLEVIVDEAHSLRDRPPSANFGALEEDLEEHIEQSLGEHDTDHFSASSPKRDSAPASPLYQLFLRRLISGSYVSPHETFAHPVTSVIAISSQNPSAIESLRQLYEQTSRGNRVLPPWANPEYLRYYVLVHDDDRDDISKSNALFDQMKRHFGLHCHLLRLRSVRTSLDSDHIVPTMEAEWISPVEDLNILRKTDDLIEMDMVEPSLYESDANAIRAFVRELVTQSVVPHMESRIALWNDQVASKRRGISGRFMSMSKRWAGFGSSRNSSSPTSSGLGGSGGNYDALQGYYRWETAEALLRKLADYSFMLRDYKLAASTYEMLRSDFNNDKAWKHLAGANEMCVISNLLNPMSTAAKMKVESLDQMLETAIYSYLTRCSDPQHALRSMALAVELLRIRSKAGAEASAKWAIKILELGLVGSVGHVLVSERIAACFMAYQGSGLTGWGARKRKTAFWYVMAAEEWLKLGQIASASASLEQADWLYRNASSKSDSSLPYPEMQAFLEQLQLAVKMKTNTDGVNHEENDLTLQPPQTEEVSEKLDIRHHRRSLIAPVNNAFDMGPLSPTRLPRDEIPRDDDFE